MAGQEINLTIRNLNFGPNNGDPLPGARNRQVDIEELPNRELMIEYLNRVNDTSRTNPANRATKFADTEDAAIKKYIGSGVAFVSLVAENLLSHPFIVLRRQCQVHHVSRKYHVLPFTLIPSVISLHKRQGVTTLWKGLGSSLLVRGMSLGIEDLISKVTPWPKEISIDSTLKQIFQHTLLKCVSLAIVTPFYSASFVETVQSEIASESPGIFDVFREGFMRLLYWSAPSKGRMLPIWALIVPTVTLGVAKYIFGLMVKGASIRLFSARYRTRHEVLGALPKDYDAVPAKQDLQLMGSIFSTIVTDVLFYPCETVVHRLHLQGTRTIVDNLDTGKSVLPILTNYTGPVDCYESCLMSEGRFGLYKGFGALILQYTVHIALIRMSRFLLSEIGGVFYKPKKVAPVQQADVSPPVISNLTSSQRSYLLP